jgi:hypothetical protein
MADKPGYYWDYRECAWVRFDLPRSEQPVEVPQQTSVEDAEVADVRSG